MAEQQRHHCLFVYPRVEKLAFESFHSFGQSSRPPVHHLCSLLFFFFFLEYLNMPISEHNVGGT